MSRRLLTSTADVCTTSVVTIATVTSPRPSTSWSTAAAPTGIWFPSLPACSFVGDLSGTIVTLEDVEHLILLVTLVIISSFPVFQFWWFSEDVVAVLANECHHRAHYCLIHSWFINRWFYRANAQCSCDTSSIDA